MKKISFSQDLNNEQSKGKREKESGNYVIKNISNGIHCEKVQLPLQAQVSDT